MGVLNGARGQGFAGGGVGSVVTVTNTTIAATQTAALTLSNTTAATVGAQEFSPGLKLIGNGWKTDATAGSQQCDWFVQLEPVQGAASPTSLLRFSSDVNVSGTRVTALSLTSAGGVQIGAPVTTVAAAQGMVCVANERYLQGAYSNSFYNLVGVGSNGETVVGNVSQNWRARSLTNWNFQNGASSTALTLNTTGAVWGDDTSSALSGAFTFRAANGGGTDRVGLNIVVAAGAGTGAATPPTIAFQTSTVLGSGTTTQTLTTRLTIASTVITAALPFIPGSFTTAARDALTPAAGWTIYNTSTNKLNFYNGATWEAVTSA